MKTRFHPALALAQFLVLTVCACGGGSGGGTAQVTGSAAAGESIAFSVESGAPTIFTLQGSPQKLAAVAEAPGTFAAIIELRGPNNETYVDQSGEMLSLASEPQAHLATAVAPSRAQDPALSAGEYLIRVETDSGQPAAVTVHTSDDPDLQRGSLSLNIFLVGAIAQQPGFKEAAADAVEAAKRIYRSAGIELQIAVFEIGGPLLLPLPIFPDTLYEQASAQAPSPAVNVFLGADIDASGLPVVGAVVLGIASSIPGPPFPGPRSAVAISLLAAAGPDGAFSARDAAHLGQTIAHESGHFIGLFHPVEIDIRSERVVGADPLPDTETCGTLDGCLLNQNLVRNLMFPFPVLDSGGALVEQNELTAAQGGVLNRYFAVR